jgi:signal transduction histidine kinase
MALYRRFSWRVYRDAQPPRGMATAAVLVGIFAVLAFAIRVFCRDSHGWSPFWPANGAIVVALLVLPKRLGLSVLIIDGVINMMVNTFYHYTFQTLIVDAILNCGAGLILAILVRNFCGAATDLSRFRRLVTFMGLAVVAAGIEAAVGEGLDAIARTPDVDIGGWFWWTLCDGLGLIIATPAVLLCVKNKRYLELQHARLAQRIGLFALILAVATGAFLQSHSALWVFVYPLLLLMAFSAGPPWVLASVLIVSIVASGLTFHGYGPLVSLAPTDARMKQNVVQQFLLSLFVCAVPANNALGEMGRVAQRLRRIHATAREAQSAAVTANLAKSQFIANVSHEIRTPLNGVLGMAQVLAAGDLSALQRERVEIIHSSGEVLLSILNDVLDFSKIEAGKLDLEATPFDLVKVVQHVQAAFSAVAQTKGLKLELRLEGRSDPGEAGDLYVGDPTRVRQIISNLVSNALKFTPAGAVEIGVSGRGRDVVVWVRDTGVGIPQDRLPKLFGQFEQVDASTTRRFGGTGLGLSICHELCRLMGGRIVVESRLGQGSTFTVHLPLSRVGAPEAALAPELSRDCAKGDLATQELRILAAEDNKINQLVLTSLLQQIGVTATVVENGALAVEAWRESEFDLILMDMQMPVMDGLAAVRAIRAAEALSSRRRRPIIALTADVMSHHLEDYRHAGVDAVVAKPLQFGELALTMQTLLDPAADLDAPALMTA